MANFDVFNGDADGICALLQLRLAQPLESELVTGVKRDISLLKQVQAQPGDQICVLDVSLDKNRDALVQVLEQQAEVLYVDHHFAGEIPASDKLSTIINTDANVCTSLLINGHLKGEYLAWAVVGAFGDNLKNSAKIAAKPLNLSDAELEQLENLGIYINYNGYGSDLADLHFPPKDLYLKLSQFADPFAFMREDKASFDKLEQGYHSDMAAAQALKADSEDEVAAVFTLPNEAWARRVSGVYSNDLANAHPDRAHGVLTDKGDGTFLVSVRAPLNNKTGADEICRQFETGGGRAAAAGINSLPAEEVGRFIDTLRGFYAK